MASHPWILLYLLASLLARCANARRPLIIGHRGSPCRFPEETVRGFQYAVDAGVDFVEMDVISTKDSVLIAHHDLTLDATSNVAEIKAFRGRNTTKCESLFCIGEMRGDGRKVEVGMQSGFFAVDFTLEEIKEIRARQAMPFRDHIYDDQLEIPTLLEVLEVVKKAREGGKQVGAYIETKQPEFHRWHKKQHPSIPNPCRALFCRNLEKMLVKDLKNSGLLHDPGAIYLESFSKPSLKTLHKELGKEGVTLPSTWLMYCSITLPSLSELQEFAQFGTAIGPGKEMLVEMDYFNPECSRSKKAPCFQVDPGQTCTGRLKKSENGSAILTPLLHMAREANLQIHGYTFRNEERFMALDFLADPAAEMEFYSNEQNAIEMDGIFVDCPETASALFSSPPSPTSPSRHRSSSKALIWIVTLLAVGVLLGLAGYVFYLRYSKRKAMIRFRELASDIELRDGP